MWTPDALRSEAAAYAGPVWRLVEAQGRTATVRLTDSLDEQRILEDLIEEAKPTLPEDCRGLHSLLATPFRYAPYPNGSRFRRAGQTDGVFYAAEHVETAVAETAFYLLLFFLESPGMRHPARPVERTAFRVACATQRTIDLSRPPLDAAAADWLRPTDYTACQALADRAREAGLEAIRSMSVRDPDRRATVSLLTPRAFAAPAPDTWQTWHIFVRTDRIQAWCAFPPVGLEFRHTDFAADPRVDAPPKP